MGLLDILNGMQNGPRGQQQPKNIGSSGGMSPIMKALLGVLAYKALKGGSGQAAAPEGMGHPVPLPPRGNIMLAPQEVDLATFWVGCLAASQVQQPLVPSPTEVWATCSAVCLVAPLPEAC